MKLQYVAYLMLFVAGVWGGGELVKLLTSNDEDITLAANQQRNLHVSDFSLNDIEGKTHLFSEWEDKVRVLNFWATWCPPCRRETPMFVEMQTKFGDKGLQFVGVAIDEKQSVIDFMDSYGVNYPMLIGTDDAIKVAEQYGNRFGALPWTVVIDRSGTIVHAQGGEFTRQKADEVISPLL
jgi:thiol-disulfide isomerase/thioredoxin